MYIAALLIDVLILISLMPVGQTIDRLEAKFMTEAASIRDEVNNLRIQVTGELMSIKDNIKLLIQLAIRSHKTQVSEHRTTINLIRCSSNYIGEHRCTHFHSTTSSNTIVEHYRCSSL